MEQPPSKAPSIGKRGKAAARRLTAPIVSATNAVTGKNVEHQVAEYTETFTQVVLGLHEDHAAALRRIDELETKTSNLLGGVALVVALVALGVALWAAL